MKKFKILVSLISLLGVFSFTNAVAMEKKENKKIELNAEKNLFENNEQKEEFVPEPFPVKVEVKDYYVNDPGKGEIKIIFDLSADETFSSRYWRHCMGELKQYFISAKKCAQKLYDEDNNVENSEQLSNAVDQDQQEFDYALKSIFSLGENDKYNKISENAFDGENLLKILIRFCEPFKTTYGSLSKLKDENLFSRGRSNDFYSLRTNRFKNFVSMLKNFESKIEFDDPNGYKNNENFNGRVIIKISNSKDSLKESFKYFQNYVLNIFQHFRFEPFVVARAFFYIVMEKYNRDRGFSDTAIEKEYHINLNNNMLLNDYVLSKEKRERIMSEAEEGGVNFNGTYKDFNKFFEIAYDWINNYGEYVRASNEEEYRILGTLFYPENIDYIRFSNDGSKIIFKFKKAPEIFTAPSLDDIKEYKIDVNLFKLLNFEQYVKGWKISSLKSYANIIREIVFMYKERVPKEQKFLENFGKEEEVGKEIEKIYEKGKEKETEFSFEVNLFDYLNYFFKNIKREIAEKVEKKKIKIDGTEEDFNRFYEVVYNKLLTTPEYENNTYLKDLFRPENIQYIINNDLGKKINFKIKNKGDFFKEGNFELSKEFKDLFIQIVLLYKEIYEEQKWQNFIDLIRKETSSKKEEKNIEKFNEAELKNKENEEENYFEKQNKKELGSEKEELKKLREEAEKLKKELNMRKERDSKNNSELFKITNENNFSIGKEKNEIKNENVNIEQKKEDEK